MKRKIVLLTIFMTAFLFFNVFATPKSNYSDIFKKGNQLYRKGQYTEAILEYEKILSGEFEIANVYYNLGNCYFKKGLLGKAILNYERAKRLNPKDKDVDFNYKHARFLIKQKIAISKKNWFLRVRDNFLDKHSLNSVTIILSLLYISLLLGIIITRILKIATSKFIVFLVFLGISFLIAGQYLHKRVNAIDKEAIIVKDDVAANFEPFERATTHYVLSEGMKVKIMTEKDGWYKVKRIDGKVGWIKSDKLEKI